MTTINTNPKVESLLHTIKVHKLRVDFYKLQLSKKDLSLNDKLTAEHFLKNNELWLNSYRKELEELLAN